MFSLIFCENGLETLGFNSPSHNPENCRLNGDKKLLTQKINIRPSQYLVPFIFRTKCDFL